MDLPCPLVAVFQCHLVQIKLNTFFTDYIHHNLQSLKLSILNGTSGYVLIKNSFNSFSHVT